MVTANTSARLHAAQNLTEAGKLIQESRAYVHFKASHGLKFDLILEQIEMLINFSMRSPEDDVLRRGGGD